MRRFCFFLLIFALAFSPNAGALLFPPVHESPLTGRGAVNLGVVGDVLASIGETFTGTAGLDPTNLPKLVNVKVGVQQILAELPKTCPKCVEWLNGKNFDPDESADIEKTVNETARVHGLSMEEFKLYALPDGRGGMHNSDNGGSVALNILNRDGSGFSSGEQRVSSFGHEAGGHNSGIVDGESFANLMGRYAVGAMDLSNWLNGNERTTDAGSAADWRATYGNSDYVRGNNAFADDLRKKEGTQYDSLYDHSKHTFLNDLANGLGLISDEKAAENRQVNDAKLLVQAEKITDMLASVNSLAALIKNPEQQRYLVEHFDEVIALGLVSKKEEFDRMMVELGSSDPVVAARAQARLEAGIKRAADEALFTVVTAGDGAVLSALARGGDLIKDLKLARKTMAAEVDAVKVAGKVPTSAAGGAQKYINIIPEDRAKHILYGDGPNSGGHLWPGQPGKTAFPQDWSADKVLHEVSDILTNPNTKWYAQTGSGGIRTSAGDPARWISYELRDGVRIRVVYEPATGCVRTAFPDNTPMPNYKPVK